jgi:hypothetical protein
MQKSFRVAIVIALIGAGIWSWRVLFPNPQNAIRARLRKLAETASIEPGQGTLPKAFKAQKLADYFTPDVSIKVDIRGYEMDMWNGRDELIQKAAIRMQQPGGLTVEFLDINVTLEPDGQTAVANLTGKATVPGDRDFFVQEFNFRLKKISGQWYINEIESVKTLSDGQPVQPVPAHSNEQGSH